MDKLGTSQKAGNKGIPATSRDGAPIELTALLAKCLDFMIGLQEEGHSNFKGVKIKAGILTFKEWRNRIQDNFEAFYYIPKDET